MSPQSKLPGKPAGVCCSVLPFAAPQTDQNRAVSRVQALRQAILALIDGPGYINTRVNKIIFSCAHPIFWAPFSLIGDGGARRLGV